MNKIDSTNNVQAPSIISDYKSQKSVANIDEQIDPKKDYSDILELSKYNCDCGECEKCFAKSNNKELSDEDKKKVDELKKRDQHVKQHEQAHVAKGASNPNYKYEIGPDGNKYAVGGNAEIELSEGSTPTETIAKAEKVKAAALAPSDPSSQDQKVAAEADSMKRDAEKELKEKGNEGNKLSFNDAGNNLDITA